MMAITTRSSIRVKAGRLRRSHGDVFSRGMKLFRVADTYMSSSCYDRVQEVYLYRRLNLLQAWRSLTRSWRTHSRFENDLRDRRTSRGWSQERAGPAVGAVARGDQRDRDRPAGPLGRGGPGPGRGTRVPGRGPVPPAPCRAPRPPGHGLLVANPADTGRPRWVGARLYPAEATRRGWSLTTVSTGAARSSGRRGRPRRTLVMACCDPAAGLLAAELARAADVRLLALPRSSRTALTLSGGGWSTSPGST